MDFATIVYLEIQKPPTKICKLAENANAYDLTTKIHTQFAHPSKLQLKILLTDINLTRNQ